MPSYPPREDTIKKQDQLLRRKTELRKTILKGEVGEKLILAVQKYREANLSLLKARLHVIREKEFQTKVQDANVDNVANQIENWTKIPDHQIIMEMD